MTHWKDQNKSPENDSKNFWIWTLKKKTLKQLSSSSSSLFFYTAAFYSLFILYILVYICQSQSPNSSHHHHHHPCVPPFVSIRLFSTPVSLFLPCKTVHLYHFPRFHIYALIYNICFLFLTHFIGSQNFLILSS